MSHFWYESTRGASAMDYLHGHGMEGLEHGLSGGVFVSLFFFALGSVVLTGAEGPRARAGEFIGYDSAGSPLYLHGEDFLKKTTSNVATFAKATMAQIWASPDSRSIFYFLCLNLAFCGVEFLYGILTNSLGLISDAFHMLFDCTALVMGLVASVMSRSQLPSLPHVPLSYGRALQGGRRRGALATAMDEWRSSQASSMPSSWVRLLLFSQHDW